jgi:hypothetical protein
MSQLKTIYPSIRFDVANLILPRMRQGYIGRNDCNDNSDIPFFDVFSRTRAAADVRVSFSFFSLTLTLKVLSLNSFLIVFTFN